MTHFQAEREAVLEMDGESIGKAETRVCSAE